MSCEQKACDQPMTHRTERLGGRGRGRGSETERERERGTEGDRKREREKEKERSRGRVCTHRVTLIMYFDHWRHSHQR